MKDLLNGRGAKMALRVAVLAGAGLSVSGCYGDFGLGYASDGYSSAYDCDPYSPYDRYYDCDYGYGFSNIGYGGGWFDNYYYPGYGVFLFDTYGRRYNMRDNHRHYWAGRRHDWYRSYHDGRGRRDGNRNDYTGRDGNRGQIGWPEKDGHRARDRDGDYVRADRQRDDRQRDGRRRGDWQSGNNSHSVPPVADQALPGRGDGNRGGRRGGNRALNVPDNEGTAPAQGGRGNRGVYRTPRPPAQAAPALLPEQQQQVTRQRPQPSAAQQAKREARQELREQENK